MILKKLRISQHLSQEQLAQMAGLNIRTIQRVESGSNTSLESLKCLAAALEVDATAYFDRSTATARRGKHRVHGLPLQVAPGVREAVHVLVAASQPHLLP